MRENRRPQPGGTMTRSATPARVALAASIRDAIAEATAAQPVQFRETFAGSDEYRALPSPIPAASLRAVPIAFRRDLAGDLLGATATTEPTQPAALGDAIAARSVLAQLGLSLVTVQGQAEPLTHVKGADGQAVGVMQTTRAEFSTVRPAPFATPIEDDDFSEVALLADVTAIAASGLRLHGFRHRMNRAALKDRPAETLAAEFAESILAGAGRLIDRLALDSLATDGGLPLGDIRAAGAAGVQFDRLRAVIGRLGPSGEFALPDMQAIEGRLYHSGVPAVFTSEAAGGWLGDWATHCVAVTPELHVLAHKLNARGDLQLSAWLGATGISPTPGTRIWRLA